MGRIQFTYFSKTMVEAFLQKKKPLLDWQHNGEQIKICVQRSAPPYHHRRQTIQNGSEDHRHSMQAFGLVPFKHFTHWCSGQCCHHKGRRFLIQTPAGPLVCGVCMLSTGRVGFLSVAPSFSYSPKTCMLDLCYVNAQTQHLQYIALQNLCNFT